MAHLQRLTTAPAAAPFRSLALRVLAARDYDRGRVSVPAERAKRRHLLSLFEERGHRVFVESGTYLGGTVAFFAPRAERVISVEVDRALYERAAQRFARTPNVQIVFGDALDEIPEIVAGLDAPPLIWLDGHFSDGITSQGAEEEPAGTILQRLGERGVPAGTTIVIDDIRLFGTDPGFPPLADVVTMLGDSFPGARVSVGLDALVARL